MSGYIGREDADREDGFRATGARIFLCALAISAYHRRSADRLSGGGVPWREEGLLMILALRLSGLALWLSTGAYLTNPRSMRWSRLPLPAPVRWAGAGTGIASLPLLLWLFRSIGGNITPTVATRPGHTLVTHGPYRWVRHPLYSVGSLLFGSLAVLSANWFIGLSTLSTLALLLLRLPKEERKLAERFGREYEAYTERTGKLMPRLRR